jgi:hypothetical protein
MGRWVGSAYGRRELTLVPNVLVKNVCFELGDKKAIKDAMMSKLLTGKTRLKEAKYE